MVRLYRRQLGHKSPEAYGRHNPDPNPLWAAKWSQIGSLRGHPSHSRPWEKMTFRQNYDCALWNTKKNTITVKQPNA